MKDITNQEIEEYNKNREMKYKKENGIIYPNTEYKVPFRSEDAVALIQVKSAFELGLQYTNIKFSNGTTMPMTPDKFLEFSKWFVEQRNQFFI